MIIIGTIINLCGILLGGTVGLLTHRSLSASHQTSLKTLLGVLTILAGLQLAWTHFGGGIRECVKLFLIVMVAMSLGKLMGRLLHLQRASNRMGQYASAIIDRVSRNKDPQITDGFITCAILFCAAPLSVLGAVQEGLSGDWRAFAIKAIMDGMATFAIVGVLGSSVLLVALPVLAWQGSLTLAVKVAQPWLTQHGLVDSIQVTGGLLLFSLALIIFEIRKVPVADYLPSLAIAPMIVWLAR